MELLCCLVVSLLVPALRMSNIKNYKYDWKWEKEQGVGQLNCKRRPLKKLKIF